MYQTIFLFFMFQDEYKCLMLVFICIKMLFSLKNKQFYHAVSTTNWDEIDRATDTQQAFDLFHN